MSLSGMRLSPVILSVLALWAFTGDIRPASAAAQRLVVAGAPPAHEATLPHQGSISQKLPSATASS